MDRPDDFEKNNTALVTQPTSVSVLVAFFACYYIISISKS